MTSHPSDEQELLKTFLRGAIHKWFEDNGVEVTKSDFFSPSVMKCFWVSIDSSQCIAIGLLAQPKMISYSPVSKKPIYDPYERILSGRELKDGEIAVYTTDYTILSGQLAKEYPDETMPTPPEAECSTTEEAFLSRRPHAFSLLT